MLELMLLRHAKSDWDAQYSLDRDRPLNGRGIRSARAVGDYVAQSGSIPDLALTSPAVRARTTLELAAEAGQWSTSVQVVPEIYSGGPAELLEAVRGVTDAERVLVVGHEPILSTTVSGLVGGGSFRVPTAALVEFRLHIPGWEYLRWGAAELVSFSRSRSLLKAGFGNDRKS